MPQSRGYSDAKTLHPLLATTLQHQMSRRSRTDGSAPVREDETLQTNLSPDGQDRAFRLLDALFKAAEGKGYSVAIDKGQGNKRVVITVGDQPVGVTIKEHLKQVPHVPTKSELADAKKYTWATPRPYDLEPSGELTFIVENIWGRRRNWSEGKRWKLEDRVPAVLAGIEQAAANLRANRLEWERKERERLERERRVAEERRRMAILQLQIRAWHRAEEIRAFVGALSNLIEERRAAGQAIESVDQYLKWALGLADRIDPRTAVLTGGTLPSDAREWMVLNEASDRLWLD